MARPHPPPHKRERCEDASSLAPWVVVVAVAQHGQSRLDESRAGNSTGSYARNRAPPLRQAWLVLPKSRGCPPARHAGPPVQSVHAPGALESLERELPAPVEDEIVTRGRELADEGGNEDLAACGRSGDAGGDDDVATEEI